MQELFALISSIAPTDYSVLIRGESGTGKELVARSIHNLSPRKDREFITVNCPALPEHLLESELFGYKKGAFTGALQDKKGLFQEAHGSSILLDEIADIPIPVQTKLLRVLQEQEIRPLGSNKNTPVDVRILSTTNQDLEQKLQDKTFREDLFFRLNVVTIKTPALEEIKDDIPLMVDFFIQQTCAEMDIPPKPFSPGAIERLKHRAWPGNVRELQNVVRRALIFSTENEVTPGDITQVETNEQKRENSVENPRGEGLEPYNQAKERVLQKFSAEYVEHLMQETGGNISQAAKLGGLSRVALQKILRRTGVDPQRFREE
jgi:DNA-binding NtrC family response regulator